MVGQASLTHDELLTAVTEIESIINSRPLSYLSAGDTEEPLTPSHLVIGHRVLNLPDYLHHMCDPEDEEFDVDSTLLTRRMKHLSSTLNHFWKRWRNEYLAELRESHKHLLGKTRGAPNIAVGDMVIVHEEGLPRSFWKLGRIKELIVGKDGQTRGATVRVAGRGRNHTTLNRPLQLLYPLEVPDGKDVARTSDSEKELQPADRSEPDSPVVENHEQASTKRPQRASAREGEEKRRLWAAQLDYF